MLNEYIISFVRRSNRAYDDAISNESLQCETDIFYNEAELSEISKERKWASSKSVAFGNHTLLKTECVHNNVLG